MKITKKDNKFFRNNNPNNPNNNNKNSNNSNNSNQYQLSLHNIIHFHYLIRWFYNVYLKVKKMSKVYNLSLKIPYPLLIGRKNKKVNLTNKVIYML